MRRTALALLLLAAAGPAVAAPDPGARGRELMAQGHFHEAEAALARADGAEAAFYLGLCREMTGELVGAATAYRLALSRGLAPELAKAASLRLSLLPPAPEPPSPNPAVPTAPPEPDLESEMPRNALHRRHLLYAGAAGAISLGALATGVIFGVKELRTQRDFNAAPSVGLQSQGRQQALLADLFVSAGLAAGAFALYHLFVDHDERGSAEPAVGVGPAPGLGASLSLRF